MSSSFFWPAFAVPVIRDLWEIVPDCVIRPEAQGASILAPLALGDRVASSQHG